MASCRSGKSAWDEENDRRTYSSIVALKVSSESRDRRDTMNYSSVSIRGDRAEGGTHTTTTLNFFPARAAERILSTMALPMRFWTGPWPGVVLVTKNWFSLRRSASILRDEKREDCNSHVDVVRSLSNHLAVRLRHDPHQPTESECRIEEDSPSGSSSP